MATSTKTRPPKTSTPTGSTVVTSVRPGRVTCESAAQYLGVAVQTLANWRSLGKGPRYMRDGKVHSRVYYRLSDLDDWLDAQFDAHTG